MKAVTYSIFTVLLALIACTPKTPSGELINQKASLPATFSVSDLHQKVLTAVINKKEHTMSLLYGDAAAELALKSAIPAQATNFSFTLVTWQQQDDAHWFGARIPGDLISVEKLAKKGADASLVYQKLSGKKLTTVTDTTGTAGRIQFMLSQKVSILP
ncbi:hypothetical protein C8P68_104106 [Mucilaginibacter yixingensis]|uniref:Uncharacterized protein n=1 Tax=Mucilaginibacter yixingensis TaxID=1295612 RepID=A0A2T5J971_9SPHI|nr:hypothetical protein [Mucilaginibacter yixingensis]PTQ96621.1 hypothetical protein C8P68_104106 [Mucilaginibacter yixingensis]